MSYPKWVQRAPHIGAVLCLTEEEEKQLLDDWKSQQESSVDDLVGDVKADKKKKPAE